MQHATYTKFELSVTFHSCISEFCVGYQLLLVVAEPALSPGGRKNILGLRALHLSESKC